MKESKLYKSIIEVSKAVKNIDKSMTVGEGRNAYKGVADKDVKFIIGQAMAEHGLTCVCTGIEPKTTMERWEETNTYGTKQKQLVFTEVICRYKITHAETSESVDICGYGHGVDSMDKGAGKATTYALKNALLYLFLVPTGSIDDTDNTHSDNISVPKPKAKKPISDERFSKALEAISEGKSTKEDLTENFELTVMQSNMLNEI